MTLAPPDKTPDVGSVDMGPNIGNYRLIRQLGQGGMGIVYEAVREGIGGRIALKVLRPEYARNKELATRFFDEARAANLIDHAGIVKVFEHGQTPDGTAFLAMEFLAGESLRDRLKRVSRLAEADAVRLGRQMAQALAAAHEKKIIHRDLKPDNVMIIPDAEAASGERAKILDFGIAKVTESNGQQAAQTRTGSLMGTPAYMSPEQCRGAGQIDDRADVYAFGVMLYHMLAGQPPFTAQSDFDVMALHIYNSPPPLQQQVPNLSRELTTLVDATLRKAPAERPSMSEVAAELQRLSAQSGQSLSGLRTSPWSVDPSRRPARRWGLVVLALCGVAALALVLVLRERKEPPLLVHPVVTPNPVLPVPVPDKPHSLVAEVPTTKPTIPAGPAGPAVPNTDTSSPDRTVTHKSTGSTQHATKDDKVTPHATKDDKVAPHAAKDEDVAERLKLSLNQYMQGSFGKAIKTAQPCTRESPQQAFRIIGSAACHLKKLPLINEAYRRVDEGGRKYIVLVCQSQGLGLSAKQEFQAIK